MSTYEQGKLFDRLYDGLPPHQRHSDTSTLAALQLDEDRRATLRAAVRRYVLARGQDGATDEEIQDALEMEGNTQRPRRRELELAGIIVDSGQRRMTHKGRKAAVWVHA